jgi:hypothetical protein
MRGFDMPRLLMQAISEIEKLPGETQGVVAARILS